MSDDKKPPTPTPAAEPPGFRDEASKPPASEPTASVFGLPLAAFVKGGTSTSRNDRAVAEEEADAEKRRDIAAEERRIARVPIEQGGGKMYANRFTENTSVPQVYALLDYLTARGEPMMYLGQPVQCLADITLSGKRLDFGGFGPLGQEMILLLVCPQCIKRGTPQGQAQMQIRQSNKPWELDTTTAGQPIAFEGNVYPSAGRVVECPPFRCDKCGWEARIYDNKVRAL